MNYRYGFLIALMIVQQVIVADSYGTFFRARPLSQMVELENALDFYAFFNKEAECGDRKFRLDFQQTFCYFHSTRPEHTGKYFSPDALSQIEVRELNVGDVGSLWFDVIAETNSFYESTMKIRPVRNLGGGLFKMFIDLDSLAPNMWASIMLPVAYVSHKSGLSETLVIPGVSPGYASVSASLNSGRYKYSVISKRSKHNVLIDDVVGKIGAQIFDNDKQRCNAYAIAFIPTSKASSAQTIFEPTLGSGHHAGFGGGLTMESCLWVCGTAKASLLLDARYAYYLNHKEQRTVDLKNGNWSRYFTIDEFSNMADPIRQLGPNIFTGEFSVCPRSMVDAWAALHYNDCTFNAEFGYNFWWHGGERIGFGNYSPKANIGIVPAPENNTFPTASTATIAKSNVVGPNPLIVDATPVFITADDYDLQSAAQKSAASSTFYMAFSYDLCKESVLSAMGVGGSYEMAHNNAALSQVGVWVKGTIAF